MRPVAGVREILRDGVKLDTKVRLAAESNRLIPCGVPGVTRSKAQTLFWWIPRTITDEGDMAQMHNPPHPGEVLKDTVLRADGGITVTEFAKRLGVSRVALSRVVNGKAAVSAELAIRLAAALRGSAESWLRMQLAYDLWHAQKKRRPKIEPLDANIVAG